MSDSRELTLKQENFLAALETCDSVAQAAELSGITVDYAYQLTKTLADEIQERAQSVLSMASLKAAKEVSSLISADNDTQKGELRLKAATETLDRTGVTKHTNIEVSVEAKDGLFIIPSKSIVPANPEDS